LILVDMVWYGFDQNLDTFWTPTVFPALV